MVWLSAAQQYNEITRIGRPWAGTHQNVYRPTFLISVSNAQ